MSRITVKHLSDDQIKALRPTRSKYDELFKTISGLKRHGECVVLPAPKGDSLTAHMNRLKVAVAKRVDDIVKEGFKVIFRQDTENNAALIALVALEDDTPRKPASKSEPKKKTTKKKPRAAKAKPSVDTSETTEG
jgi:hypothetical protein